MCVHLLAIVVVVAVVVVVVVVDAGHDYLKGEQVREQESFSIIPLSTLSCSWPTEAFKLRSLFLLFSPFLLFSGISVTIPMTLQRTP